MSKQSKQIYSNLREGEELIWTGNPSEDKRWCRADWVLIPVSAIMLAVSTAFGALAVASALRFGLGIRQIVTLMIFLLVGGFSAYCYFFRFLTKRRVKTDLVYGVTNQGRVLIRDDDDQMLFEYEDEDVADAYISEANRYGVGTIYLRRRRNWFDNTGLDFMGGMDGSNIALYDIPDCKRVLKLIRKSIKK